MSRAVADKYALLPGGTIVPLSRFFGVSGGVDEELRKLLESADGPMSDQRLAERLREAGYPIARRTVAKHRARLGLAAASVALSAVRPPDPPRAGDGPLLAVIRAYAEPARPGGAMHDPARPASAARTTRAFAALHGAPAVGEPGGVRASSWRPSCST